MFIARLLGWIGDAQSQDERDGCNPTGGVEIFPVSLCPARSAKRVFPLARISHRIKRIGAPNQRKLFCENDFLMIRGEPRCRQSVSRICLDLKPLKAAK